MTVRQGIASKLGSDKEPLEIAPQRLTRDAKISSACAGSYATFLRVARDNFQRFRAMTQQLPPERKSLYRDRSKEMAAAFRSAGLDLEKFAALDRKFAEQDLADAEALREAYRRDGPSDLTRYLTAKASQVYALSPGEHLLLPELVATLNESQLQPDGDPPPPDDITLTNTDVSHLDLKATGHGTWWWEMVEVYSAAQFQFSFVPSAAAYATTYTFNSLLQLVGYSLFAADHQWDNNKGAAGSICLLVSVTQDVPYQEGSYSLFDGQIFFKHIDNGNSLNYMNQSVPISANVLLYTGIRATFYVSVAVTMSATGGGSVAEVNFGSRPGDGIYCPSVKISMQ